MDDIYTRDNLETSVSPKDQIKVRMTTKKLQTHHEHFRVVVSCANWNALNSKKMNPIKIRKMSKLRKNK